MDNSFLQSLRGALKSGQVQPQQATASETTQEQTPRFNSLAEERVTLGKNIMNAARKTGDLAGSDLMDFYFRDPQTGDAQLILVTANTSKPKYIHYSFPKDENRWVKTNGGEARLEDVNGYIEKATGGMRVYNLDGQVRPISSRKSNRFLSANDSAYKTWNTNTDYGSDLVSGEDQWIGSNAEKAAQTNFNTLFRGSFDNNDGAYISPEQRRYNQLMSQPNAKANRRAYNQQLTGDVNFFNANNKTNNQSSFTSFLEQLRKSQVGL